MDDDHIRPATNASSCSPSIPQTSSPSSSTFVDDSTFVRSTFLTKPALARPTAPAALGNTAVDKPAQADDGGASFFPLRGSWVTSVIAALVISTVFFAI
jgi:hypothetical protein